MHIAYFTNQYPKVSHSFIRREILSLERQGLQVSRIAIRGWDAEVVDEEDREEKNKTRYLLKAGMGSFFVAAGRRLIRTPRRFLSALLLACKMARRADRALPYHLMYFLEACQLLEYWSDSKPTHIHAHFGTNSAEVVMLARSLGGPPYSFTVHGPEEFDKPEALHIGDKIKLAKFVVAISSFGRSQLFRTVDLEHWPKVKEIHCGLEAAFYEVPVATVPDTNRLLCIGRLCEQKGQLLLVEAARKLAEKGVSFQLILAGDGEMRAEVERLIREYELQQKVTITGWISSDQVRAELLASRAMVLPSFAEGLPVVIMEAMALRRPVLSTYVAGIPELVIPGENGWLFPAGSIDALVEACEECLKTPVETLSKMGNAGFSRVRERHDIETETKKLADLFDMPLSEIPE